jgi:hypothetical protein
MDTTSLIGQQIAYQAKAAQVLYLVVDSKSGFSQQMAYQLSIQPLTDQTGQLRISRVKSFPNPVKSGQFLTVTYALSVFQITDQVTWQIYNIGGDLVYSDKQMEVVGSGRFMWPVSNIATGIYIHSIRAQRDGESHQISGKIAVVKD